MSQHYMPTISRGKGPPQPTFKRGTHSEQSGSLVHETSAAADLALESGTIVTSAIDLPLDSSSSMRLDAMLVHELRADGGRQARSAASLCSSRCRRRAPSARVRRHGERAALPKVAEDMGEGAEPPGLDGRAPWAYQRHEQQKSCWQGSRRRPREVVELVLLICAART